MMGEKTMINFKVPFSTPIACLKCSVAASALAFSGVAAAQVAVPQDRANDASAGQEPGGTEIVVTGTLIRGIAPAGTNVVALREEDVVATGATTATEVLANVPQLASFNALPSIPFAGTANTVNVPNIRNLGSSTAGGTATLILIDGHRAVSAGVNQTAVDPDIVPPSLLERVEIIAGGGSAVYGSDAIGGVINFITRKRFDGLRVDARYGFADNYNSYDANVTTGRDWGTGSIFASYGYTKHDALYGRDRDYVKMWQLSELCNPGTVHFGSTAGPAYALPGRQPGTNFCDRSDDATFYPDEQRHSVFAGLTQKLSDSLSFELKGYWSRRETTATTGAQPQLAASVTITPNSPAYVNVPGRENQNQIVVFSYEGVPHDWAQHTKMTSWGVTPTFTAKLGGDWQARLLGNYGESQTEVHRPRINTTAQTAALCATFAGDPNGAFTPDRPAAECLNPYMPQVSSAAVLSSILDFETYGLAKQRLLNTRLILDGGLIDIPGGTVKLAFGGEYIHENYSVVNRDIVPGNTALALKSAARTVKAAFAELVVPVVGPDNASTFIHSLTLSASGRYDHYDQWGGTFNPRLSATFEPVEWIAVRGNWGKSFNAPSLPDSTGAPDTASAVGGIGPFLLRPGDSAAFAARTAIRLTGGNPTLGPQRATTWQVGVDVRPPFLQGFSAGLTYWNVNFTDAIGTAPFFTPAVLYSQPWLDSGSVIVQAPGAGSPGLTPAQIDQVIAALKGSGYENDPATVAAIQGAQNGTAPLYAFIDARRRNLGTTKVKGLDFNASYTHPASFGTIDARIAGTYLLDRKSQPTPTSVALDDLVNDTSRFNFAASVGATVGKFRAQATLNHTQGFNVVPFVGNTNQTHVNSFNVVNLFFRYDFKGEQLTQDLSLTLNINNAFNQDPPLYMGTRSLIFHGFANGLTVGRFVQFGVSKKF
jgi:iron complex outermembrane receptor protein